MTNRTIDKTRLSDAFDGDTLDGGHLNVAIAVVSLDASRVLGTLEWRRIRVLMLVAVECGALEEVARRLLLALHCRLRAKVAGGRAERLAVGHVGGVGLINAMLELLASTCRVEVHLLHHFARSSGEFALLLLVTSACSRQLTLSVVWIGEGARRAAHAASELLLRVVEVS